MELSTSTTGIVTEHFDQLLCSQCDGPMDISAIEPFSRIECPGCGHPATVPAKLGHFILLDLIGKGGMGGVYIAEDASLDRMVAIKVMLESLGRNKESIATFTREAQAAARLNHPNIAQVYSIGQEGGQPYIVMELVAGQGLDRIVDAGEMPSQNQIMRIAIQVANALEAAEDTGLIHGDIKPENILLDEKGSAKLVDFGLASLAGQGNTEGIWGTPYYIAPEKVRGQKGDHRADIYSLGATLYHVLTGKPPFDGTTPGEVVKARLLGDPTPLSQVRKDITPEVEHVVMRMLKTSPALRHPTYASLIGDLKRALNALPRESVRRGKHMISPALMLTKRSPRVTQNIAIPGAAPTPPGNRPKIVFKTGRTRLTTTSRVNPEHRYRGHVTTANRKPGDPEVKARRSRRKRTILLLLLVGAAIGGAVFFSYNRNREKMAARLEAYNLAQLQDSAQTKYAEVGALTTNLSVLAVQARNLAAEATNAVVALREQPLEDSLLELLKPRGDELGAPIEQENTAGQASKTETAAASNTTDVAETAATEESQEATAPADGTGPVENGVATTPVDETAPAPLLTDEEQAYFATARLAIAVALHSDQLLAAARESALKANDEMSAALKAGTAAAAAKHVQVIDATLETIAADIQKTTELIKKAQTEVEPLLQRLKEVEKKRESARKAAEEAIRQQAIAEEAKRQEAERQALIRAELEQAKQALNAARSLLPQHRFKESVDALDLGIKTCQTSEGKTAFTIYRDRYQYLQDLKLFVIDCLNQYPQPWIWRNAQDVVKANDQTITLKGGQTVPWAEVPTAQMIKFVNTYTTHPQIRLRSQCTALLGAAIYCREHGGDTAVAAARAYANRAVTVCADLRSEKDRLLDYTEKTEMAK